MPLVVKHFQAAFRSSVLRIWHLDRRRWYSTARERSHEPLKILFCGADAFSSHSLRTLYDLHTQRPAIVESISVFCRPDKPVNRGLKNIRSPPIKAVAQELELKVHQNEGFRGWYPEDSYNLVVAVSFGLLVPERILRAAKYEGLNVHPSLLPDLRGPAPITQALLKRRNYTGVSLQTMHPIKFDQGAVLAQTQPQRIHDSRPDDLADFLGPLGADLLRKGIENEVFVPPVKDLREGMPIPWAVEAAPKITPNDRNVDWTTWTADEIILRDRVLGDLWDTQTFGRCKGSMSANTLSKHVTFHGPWHKVEHCVEDMLPGEPALVDTPYSKRGTLGITTIDGYVVAPHSATIEGKTRGSGLQGFNEQLRMRKGSQRKSQ